VPLEGLNDPQREAVSLIYNSHPSRQFIDERVHAAHIWLRFSDSEVKKYEDSKVAPADGDARQKNYTRYGIMRRPLTLTEEKAKREQEERKQRAFEFHQCQTKRFKRLANGPESFPLDETLKQIQFADPSSRYYYDQIDEVILNHGFDKDSEVTRRAGSALDTCNYHLNNLKQREACELVLWDAALPQTLEEISFFEQENQRVINEALHAKQCEEEEKRIESERMKAEEQERIRINQEKQADAERIEREKEEQRRLCPVY